ncbi:hypothetical protein F441_22899, partial [Phytophthora nicotianae CJ01A1]
LNEPNYSPPLFQTVEQYMKEHACLDNEVLQKVWLTQTTVRSRLIDAHMSVSKCAKVTKVDRSQKFRRQVMARRLTKLGNHEETTAILQPVGAKFARNPDTERIFVCDHANGLRNLRLSEAVYDVERNLRSPEAMASLFEAALAMIKPSDVSAGSEWEGSVQSNLEQIPAGDLYVDENEYYEEGA